MVYWFQLSKLIGYICTTFKPIEFVMDLLLPSHKILRTLILPYFLIEAYQPKWYETMCYSEYLWK